MGRGGELYASVMAAEIVLVWMGDVGTSDMIYDFLYIGMKAW